MEVKIPSLSVVYNDRDITAEIEKYLISLNYTDHVSGTSDEIEIVVEDSRGLWVNSWYPDKHAKLSIQYGYVSAMVRAGKFQVDEIELQGPPDAISIRGLATGTTHALRTKNTFAHEGKTLQQIAQVIADKHGYSVSGTIANISIDRANQFRETDLAFLYRIAGDYGHVFSVRDNTITFSNVYDLEGAAPVKTIHKTDCTTYNFKDKLIGTFKKGRTKHHKPLSKAAIEANAELGVSAQSGSDSADTLEIRERVEDELQADFKTKAKLHKKNSTGTTASLSLDGNPYLVAGNNFTVSGFGKYDGVYHITESRHTFEKSGGYTTDVEAKRVKK